ncbi:MAG: hypothetical protein JXJ04_05245 [Spirochaetales bacterium]|nr:hypothetical protein [Spirochaetales bacterium]
MNLKKLILFIFACSLIFSCTGKKSETGDKNKDIPETPELTEAIALDTSAAQEIVFTSIPDFYNFYMEFSKSSPNEMIAQVKQLYVENTALTYGPQPNTKNLYFS